MVSPTILVNVPAVLLVELCHCMVPIYPVKLIGVGELPIQISCELGEIFPGIDGWSTDTNNSLDAAAVHTPLVTNAL